MYFILSNEPYSTFKRQTLVKICPYKVNPMKNNDFTATFWRVYRILANFGNQHVWNTPIFAKYISGDLRIFLQVEYTFKLPKKILECLNKNCGFYLKIKGPPD